MRPIIPCLIPEWKEAWKWSSVRLMALSGMLQGVLMAFPDQLKQYVSPDVLKYLSEAALAILILAGIGRITARPGDPNVQPPHADTQP